MLNERFLITGGSGFIGTHLVEKLIRGASSVLSIDLNPPKLNHHHDRWMRCDILSIEQLGKIFDQFKPTHVLHLAAKANLKGQNIADFPENTIGTENVVHCVNASNYIERFIQFSTQYVVRPGIYPETEDFLLPYTPYGESKAEAERTIRKRCNKCWVILRPTNVWGPMHPFFPYELWKFLRLGVYFHPGYKPVTKYYSYVANAVDQIMAITLADREKLSQRVFYLSDPPIDNFEWMNAFSVAMTGKKVRQVPLGLWRFMAKTGDCLNRLGAKFPMSSDRLFRLTVEERIPYMAIIELAGPPKITLQEGVNRSVNWYMDFLAGKPAATWFI
jgi:nucleoside-diphosphate-sugar epimerase